MDQQSSVAFGHDSAQAMRDLALERSTLWFAILSFVAFLASIALAPEKRFSNPDNYIALVLSIAALAGHLMLRCGLRQYVVPLLIVMQLGLFVASTIFFGSVRTESNLLLITAIYGACMYLQLRGMIVTVIATCLVLGIMVFIERDVGFALKPSLGITWQTWALYQITLAGCAFVMYSGYQKIQRSYALELEKLRYRVQMARDRDSGTQRFELLFRTSPAPLLVISSVTEHILAANKAFLELVGMPEERLLGRRDLRFWVNDLERQDFFSTLNQQQIAETSAEFFTAAGKISFMRVGGLISYEESNALILLSFQHESAAREAGHSLIGGSSEAF